MAGPARSDPYRGASNLAGRSDGEPRKPRKRAPRETDCGMVGSAEPLGSRRRPVSASRDWTRSMTDLPGVREDGMSGRNGQRKRGTTRGSPRRSRTAKASRISRVAVKSRCACEWGGWGRLSDDGPGQHNPDLSEGPWGGGLPHPPWRCTIESSARHSAGSPKLTTRCAKGGRKPGAGWRMPGAGLSGRHLGRPHLKGQPSSRTGENPPYGMIGRVEETSGQARSAPRSYPTILCRSWLGAREGMRRA